VVVSAGISHAFGPGRVTFFENNIFGTYNAYFATDAFAQPLALSDGNQLLSAGQPLQPRTLSVNYVVNVGGAPPRASFNPLSRAASGSQVAQASAGASPGPGGAAPGGPGGGPGIPQRFLPVAPPPGTDPLSLATSRASCDADSQAQAKPALDALRAYISAYEAKKTPLPAVAVFEIVPHAASADPTVPYYLELHPKIAPPGGFSGGGQSGGGSAPPGVGPGGPGGGPPGGPGGPGGPPGGFGGPPPEGGGQSGGSEPTAAQRAAFFNSPNIKTLRGMVACQYLTVFSSSEAKAKGIVTQGGRAGLFYVPNVGLVFVRPPELPQGGGSLKQGS